MIDLDTGTSRPTASPSPVEPERIKLQGNA